MAPSCSGCARVADLTSIIVNMNGDGAEIHLVEWHTVSVTDEDPRSPSPIV
jgi:hypothetical protein